MRKKITPTKEQEEFYNDFHNKYIALFGGFGSGKSYIGAAKLLCLHAENKCTSLVVAPTYGVLRVTVDYLKEIADIFGLEYKHNKKEKKIVFPGLNNAHILLRSDQAHYTITGFGAGAILVDEAQSCVHIDYILSPLRNKEAKYRQAILTGVPKPGSRFNKFADNEATKVYRLSTANNHFLPSSYIKTLSEAGFI